MPAYLVVRIQTEDPTRLKDYQAATPSVVKKFGGRFIARGGDVVTLEGPEEKRRIVIIEFPSLEHAQQFYNSPEYEAAKGLRLPYATSEFIVVDGVKQPIP